MDTQTEILDESENYFGYELASLNQRFFAVIVESLVLIIPLILILPGYTLGSESAYNPENIFIGIVGSAILGALFYPMWSGNIGHKILGLKVISSTDGSDKKSAFDGIIREGLKNIFGYLLIPVIWLIWDKDNQNLYDKVSKTYVVRNKKS